MLPPEMIALLDDDFRALEDYLEQLAQIIEGLNTNITEIELTPGPEGPMGPEGPPGAAGANGADGLISEVRNEGVAITDAGIMDFVGAGVTASSNGTVITVTVPGGGGGSSDPLAAAALFGPGQGRRGRRESDNALTWMHGVY